MMTRMAHGTVNLDIAGRVATVTLDRPDTLNAMNNRLMQDLHSAIDQATAQSSVAVLVLTGAGRGFCSGADLSGFAGEDSASGSDTGTHSPVVDGMDRFFNPAIRAIKNCPIPTVARINGVAAGGGLGLALSCDIAVAARSAFFVATFGPRLGIVPDLGSTWSLPAKIGHTRAMAMAMLGERVSADKAVDWGLVYSAVDDEKLDAEVARLTSILERTSPVAMRRIRTAIESASTRSLSEQLDLERDHQEILIPMNMGEGAAAFVEKREPDFNRE